MKINKIKKQRNKFYGLKDFINYPEVRKKYGKCAIIIIAIMVVQYFVTLIGATIVCSIDIEKDCLETKNIINENDIKKGKPETLIELADLKTEIHKNKIKLVLMNISEGMIYILVYAMTILKYIPIYKIICKYIKK